MVFPEKYEKSDLAKQSFLHVNLEIAEFTPTKHTESPQTANNVLKMSVKLKFHCVGFEKKYYLLWCF